MSSLADTLPAGFHARGATEADAPIVVDLANVASLHDVGDVALDLDDVLTDWASPTLDLAVDAVMVLDGERPVAFAQIDEERADVDVHPDVRGRGIGMALVRWTEQRARERAVGESTVRIGQTVLDGLPGIDSLFAARGYEKLWDSWILRLPDDVVLPLDARALPPSVVVRGYEPDDEHAVYEIIDAAFSEWPGRESRPFDDWQRHTTRRSLFDPGLLVVATADDAVVGAAIGLQYEKESFVDQVAVAPAHRDRGIARALLATLFDIFHERGERTIRLNTDSRTGALGLYLDIGMVIERTYCRWSRELTVGDASIG